jgi:hypothetical protein
MEIYMTEEEIENYKEAFLEYDDDGSANISIAGNFFILALQNLWSNKGPFHENAKIE